MRLSTLLAPALLVAGALVLHAAPLTLTPFALAASTELAQSSFAIATGATPNRLEISNTGPGEIGVITTSVPGQRKLFRVKPGKTETLALPNGTTVKVIDRLEIPTSGAQVGSSGTWCLTPVP